MVSATAGLVVVAVRQDWQDGPVTDPTPSAETPAETTVGEAPQPLADAFSALTADVAADASPSAVADPPAEPDCDPADDQPEPVVVAAESLAEAVAAVRTAVKAGQCVVLPTDTVYGIGADPFSEPAVQGLLDAKQRGREMPPAVLIADAFVVDALAREVPEPARALAAAFWPGPLTLILPAHSSLRLELGETRGTVGVRVPDHEVTRAVLRATGPLAVSSANISGQPPGTDVGSARAQLGSSVAVYVDAGPTPGPVGSTIIDFAASPAGRVLRVGVVPVSEVQAVAPLVEGPETAPSEPDGPEAVAAVPDAAGQTGPTAQPSPMGEPGPTAESDQTRRSQAAAEPDPAGTGEVPAPGSADQPAAGETAGAEPGR